MKQHVWAIEPYNYSNGTVQTARAICPGNPDTARWNQQADVPRYKLCKQIDKSYVTWNEFSGRCKIIWWQQKCGKIRMNQLQ